MAKQSSGLLGSLGFVKSPGAPVPHRKHTSACETGLDEGMNLAAKYGVNAIFVDTDKNIWYNNPDVLNYFEFTGKDSGYVLNEYNQARS